MKGICFGCGDPSTFQCPKCLIELCDLCADEDNNMCLECAPKLKKIKIAAENTNKKTVGSKHINP